MDRNVPGHRSTAQEHQERSEPLFLGRMIAPETPVSAPGTETAMRVQAYSQLLAARIEQEVPFIEQFRHDYLQGGKVLPVCSLIDWVVGRVIDDGAPTPILTGVPWHVLHSQDDGSYLLPAVWANAVLELIHPNDQAMIDIESDPYDPPRLIPKNVWVPIPDSEPDWLSAEAIPIRLGGVLDKLRRFALKFRQEKYWRWRNDPSIAADQRMLWDQARIVAFVVTGYVPLLAEEQLAPPSGRGSRLQSAKHLQLAVFTVRHATESLRVRMDTWNKQYSEWAYKETSNFGWDSMEAVRRLLNQPSEPRASMAEWFERAFVAGNWQETAVIWHVETDSTVIINETRHRMAAREGKS
jgi:hypothetical protein